MLSVAWCLHFDNRKLKAEVIQTFSVLKKLTQNKKYFAIQNGNY